MSRAEQERLSGHLEWGQRVLCPAHFASLGDHSHFLVRSCQLAALPHLPAFAYLLVEVRMNDVEEFHAEEFILRIAAELLSGGIHLNKPRAFENIKPGLGDIGNRSKRLFSGKQFL